MKLEIIEVEGKYAVIKRTGDYLEKVEYLCFAGESIKTFSQNKDLVRRHCFFNTMSEAEEIFKAAYEELHSARPIEEIETIKSVEL